jgi:monoamine oxidase
MAYERFRMRLHSDPPASDRAGDALPSNDRWRPFVDGLSSFINGAELDRLSVADFLAYDDAASENNWRLPGGLGAFIASLAAGVPASLDTAVTSIDHGADGVILQTDRGTIQARAVIVTVSTAILSRGAIHFAPAVDEHLHAAGNLPLGLADKIFFSLAEPDAVPAESHLLGRLDRAGTGSYYMRPFGRPLVEAFLGGELARSLEQGGEAAAVDFALSELRDLLGGRFAQALTPLVVTRWASERSIGGSYSHALPGCAEAREVLRRPASERLCFAGEACSLHDYSTAHGAWETGLAAADWIADGLARKGEVRR